MPALPPRCPPGSLDPSSDPEGGRLVAEGRLVEAVADGTVLRGTPATLARQLGISVGDLLAAFEELTAVGWLRLAAGAQGELVVGWMDDRPHNGSGQRAGASVGGHALTGRRRSRARRRRRMASGEFARRDAGRRELPRWPVAASGWPRW